MKGIAKRSKLMFALVAIFLAGVIVLAATFGINAETWVFKRANKHIYSSGQIVAAGTIYDRNGKVVKNVTSDDKGDVEDPDNTPGGGGSDNTPGGGNTEGGGTTGGNEGDGLE